MQPALKTSHIDQTKSDEIDRSHLLFQEILQSVLQLDKTTWSEADTRLKIIDRILFEVLGWDKNEAKVEERTGIGFTDYTLRLRNSARLIVEAKKDSISFNFNNRNSADAYKLNGAVFNQAAKEAIQQTVIYSAFKNCELACVTNGDEWIIFRANRLGDGQDTLEGKGFIFKSLHDIEKKFQVFFDLLSKAAVDALKYRGEFQRVEGIPIRDLSFLKAPRDPTTKKPLNSPDFSTDFDAIMTSFFGRLKGDQDPDMINKCFVVTPESQLADEKLIRIAEGLAEKIKCVNTDTGQALIELIESAKLQHKNRFVLLVGSKSAGKSTFIERFFNLVLPPETAHSLKLLRIDFSQNSGDVNTVVSWLDQRLLEKCEEVVFDSDADAWDECVGKIFFDEYQRWSTRTMSHLYKTNKDQFKVEFGRHIEEIREKKPHDYIRKLIHYITASNGKIPCLILDNTDHFTIQFQEAVFQYARSIYESEFCIVLMPITDKTSWQLSKQGALQSFESEALFLPVPPPEKVIERRILFLLEKLQDDNATRRCEYFLNRGIRLSIKDIGDFAFSLNKVFIESRDTAKWIGGLSNHEIRRLLELTKDIIASPHLKIDDLLKAHIAGKSEAVPAYRIKQAIIKKRYDIHPMGEHSFVQNLYALSLDMPTTPLLGIRILRFLSDSKQHPDEKEQEFIPVSATYEYFTALGISPTVVYSWLMPMLRSGLILNYDPTVTELDNESRIEISPSGNIHMIWASHDIDYIQTMRDVTPLRDKETHMNIVSAYSDYKNKWQQANTNFIEYLIAEDKKWCQIPEHTNFSGQVDLTERLQKLC